MPIEGSGRNFLATFASLPSKIASLPSKISTGLDSAKATIKARVNAQRGKNIPTEEAAGGPPSSPPIKKATITPIITLERKKSEEGQFPKIVGRSPQMKADRIAKDSFFEKAKDSAVSSNLTKTRWNLLELKALGIKGGGVLEKTVQSLYTQYPAKTEALSESVIAYSNRQSATPEDKVFATKVLSCIQTCQKTKEISSEVSVLLATIPEQDRAKEAGVGPVLQRVSQYLNSDTESAYLFLNQLPREVVKVVIPKLFTELGSEKFVQIAKECFIFDLKSEDNPTTLLRGEPLGLQMTSHLLKNSFGASLPDSLGKKLSGPTKEALVETILTTVKQEIPTHISAEAKEVLSFLHGVVKEKFNENAADNAVASAFFLRYFIPLLRSEELSSHMSNQELMDLKGTSQEMMYIANGLTGKDESKVPFMQGMIVIRNEILDLLIEKNG